MSFRAPSLHYRYEPPENPAVSFPSYRLGAPLSVFRKKGPIMPELLTAHHAVHFRLCRGLSLTRSGAVVAQNRLFCLLTLPSSSKLPLNRGYGPWSPSKIQQSSLFLVCYTHT